MALFDVATGGMIVNINDVPTATRWNYPRVNPDGTLNLTVIDTEEVISVPYTGFSTGGLGSIELGPASIPIVNRINTTVTNLGGGSYRIAKTGGADGTADASAVSSVGLSGDFTLRMAVFTPPDETYFGWYGVNSDPLTDDLFTSGDHGLYFNTPGFDIFESGVGQIAFDDTGQPVWIGRRGTTLTYRQGDSFDTAAIKLTREGVTATLYFDSAIRDTTAVIDVSFFEA